MKKKVIIAATALMLATTSVVSAAAFWGKYKGYDIIRLMVDGKTVKANGTPALSLDGRTMVPINMLKDAGVNYSWDQETKTIDIDVQSGFVSQNEYLELNKVMQSNRTFLLFSDQVTHLSATIAVYRSVQTQDDFNMALQEYNRINVSILDEWVEILEGIGAKEYTSFKQIADTVYKAKNYLAIGKYNDAWNQYVTAQSALNNLYVRLDSSIDDTFGVINTTKFSE